jgi:hypothetical protein
MLEKCVATEGKNTDLMHLHNDGVSLNKLYDIYEAFSKYFQSVSSGFALETFILFINVQTFYFQFLLQTPTFKLM